MRRRDDLRLRAGGPGNAAPQRPRVRDDRRRQRTRALLTAPPRPPPPHAGVAQHIASLSLAHQRRPVGNDHRRALGLRPTQLARRGATTTAPRDAGDAVIDSAKPWPRRSRHRTEGPTRTSRTAGPRRTARAGRERTGAGDASPADAARVARAANT